MAITQQSPTGPTTLCAAFHTDSGAITGASAVYTMIWDAEIYNSSPGSYNTGTGVYTFPASGNYFITLYVLLTGLTSSHNIMSLYPNINGSPVSPQNAFNPGAIRDPYGRLFWGYSYFYTATAGQTLYFNLTIDGGSSTVGVIGVGYGDTPSYLIVNKL